MSTRRNPHSKATRQAMELALAVPQVVAHRVMRMATAGTTPSARDQREFWLMGYEKALAFNQSWLAMFTEVGRVQQQFALSALRTVWFPWLTARPGATATAAKLQRAAIDIATAGVAPIHRRAVANAKRLGRKR